MKKLLTIFVLIMLIISFFQITRMYALYKEKLEGEYTTLTGSWEIKVNESDLISGGYDNTATTWRDLAGVQDGAINGGTWENDYLHLDGVDDWVNLGYVDLTDQVTLDVTIEANEIQDVYRYALCNHESGGVAIWLTPAGIPGLEICISNVGYVNIQASKAITVGKKTRITGTYDGTNMSLYINGELVAQKAQTGVIEAQKNNTVMAIGVNPSGNNAEFAFTNINVYSTKIYNVALTEAEINSTTTPTRGLIRHYDSKNNTTTATSQVATFTIAENQLGYVASEHIQAGKIAPGGEVYFDFVIDPSNTDVSVMYQIDVGPSTGVPAKFEVTKAENYFKKDGETDKITNDTSNKSENSYISVIPVTRINAGYKNYVRLYFKWVNEEANNQTDSTLAETENAKLAIPLKITLKQYTGEVIGNGT